jgi:DNA helicase-2/ATP-dependent DNA helicase PcrA
VTITNYHSFCADVLEHYGHLVGVPGLFTVYDSNDDRIQALVQALMAEGFLAEDNQLSRTEALEMLDVIGRAKRDLVPPQALSATVSHPTRIPLRDAYRAYDAILDHNGALDFDSLLYRAYELLTTQASVSRHYRRMYRYILIDEAQDTCLAQYEILKALCGTDHRNVFMVADPAQSIYAFSGASSEFAERFVTDFGAARRQLVSNFRCAPNILIAANRLLPAERRLSANAAGTPGSYGCVDYRVHPTERDEAHAAVGWAEQLLAKGLPQNCLAPAEHKTILPESIAFVARSRINLQQLLEALDQRKTEYHFAAGEAGLFDSDEYKAILYGIKVLACPSDLAISRSLIACLRSITPENGSLPVASIALGEELLREVRDSLADSVLREPFEALNAAAVAEAGLQETIAELTSWNVESDQPSADAVDLRIADRELFKIRWDSFRALTPPDKLTWKAFLSELSSKPKPESSGFRVLTAHASKGLEFRAVAILGMNQGSFPDFRNETAKALEAERRLAYVAVTRAARLLQISRPNVRTTRFGSRVQQPSQFIAELGLSQK